MLVETKYALLEDGGRFRFDPSAEAQPTHVDGVRVTGTIAAPPIDVPDVEDGSTPAGWKKVRAVVGAVLALERPDVGAEPAAAAAQAESPADKRARLQAELDALDGE